MIKSLCFIKMWSHSSIWKYLQQPFAQLLQLLFPFFVYQYTTIFKHNQNVVVLKFSNRSSCHRFSLYILTTKTFKVFLYVILLNFLSLVYNENKLSEAAHYWTELFLSSHHHNNLTTCCNKMQQNTRKYLQILRLT